MTAASTAGGGAAAALGHCGVVREEVQVARGGGGGRCRASGSALGLIERAVAGLKRRLRLLGGRLVMQQAAQG